MHGAERELPVNCQRGARQYVTCDRWFGSAGGLAVHECTSPVVLRSRARSPPPLIDHATSRNADGEGTSPLFVSRLILDFNNTTVCVENGTLTAASLDLYVTVGGDFDRLRT